MGGHKIAACDDGGEAGAGKWTGGRRGRGLYGCRARRLLTAYRGWGVGGIKRAQLGSGTRGAFATEQTLLTNSGARSRGPLGGRVESAAPSETWPGDRTDTVFRLIHNAALLTSALASHIEFPSAISSSQRKGTLKLLRATPRSTIHDTGTVHPSCRCFRLFLFWATSALCVRREVSNESLDGMYTLCCVAMSPCLVAEIFQ